MSKKEIAYETAPVPLLAKDLIDVYRQEGKAGVAKTLPAVLGARVKTYPDRAKAEFLNTPAELRAEQKRGGEPRSFLTPHKAQKGSPNSKDETPGQFATRRSMANEWTTKYGRELVGSDAYKSATSSEQAAARAYLKSAISEQSGKVRPSLYLFSPGYILQTVRESERKKQRFASP